MTIFIVIWFTDFSIINVGGKRKTVFEYATSLSDNNTIGTISINDVQFEVPIDTSLNCDKYNKLML